MSFSKQIRALIRFHCFGNPALMIFAIVGLSQLPVLLGIGRTLTTLTVTTGWMPPVTAAIGLLMIISLLIMFVAGPVYGRMNLVTESQSLSDIEEFVVGRAVPVRMLVNFRMTLVLLFIFLLGLLLLTAGGHPDTVQVMAASWPGQERMTPEYYMEWSALMKPLIDTFGTWNPEGMHQPLKLAHHLWAFQWFQALTVAVVGAVALLLASWPPLRNLRGPLAVFAFIGLAIVPMGLFLGGYALAISMAGPLAPVRWIAQAPVASGASVTALLAFALFTASRRLQQRAWMD